MTTEETQEKIPQAITSQDIALKEIADEARTALLEELIEEVEKIPETLQMNVYIENTRQNPELIKRDDVLTLLKSKLNK